MKSQNDMLVKWMKRRWLTRKDAIDQLGIANVTARISELRQGGHNVIDEWRIERNRYGALTKFKAYRLA